MLEFYGVYRVSLGGATRCWAVLGGAGLAWAGPGTAGRVTARSLGGPDRGRSHATIPEIL